MIKAGKNRDYLKDEPDFVPLKYEKLRWKNIQEEEVFDLTEKFKDVPEDGINLFIIDGPFYDKHIVNRWTG